MRGVWLTTERDQMTVHLTLLQADGAALIERVRPGLVALELAGDEPMAVRVVAPVGVLEVVLRSALEQLAAVR